MRKERLYQIINAPCVTEKTSMSNKQIVFKVAKDATKAEIKEAVELLFETKVSSVRVLNTKGKRKTFRGRAGKVSSVKKAYVGLLEEIDYEQFMAN